MSCIKDFFAVLPECFHNENDVSDFTYCLCQANKEFKKAFLQFHFREYFTDNTKCDNAVIFREYRKTDGRPDFVIQCGTDLFIIEVKIYDVNQHFDHYMKLFPKAQKSYIANYKIRPSCDTKGYHLCTWRDFVHYVEEQPFLDDIVLGYIQYLKQIFSILEITPMNFTNITSLCSFHDWIEDTISKETATVKLNPYDYKDAYSKDWFGTYFSMESCKNNKTIYPWIGIHFSNTEKSDASYISVDFEFAKGWCDVLEEHCSKIKQKFGTCCEVKQGLLRIKLPDDKFKELNNLNPCKTDNTDKQRDNLSDDNIVHKQTDILDEFFDGVVDYIVEILEQEHTKKE